MGNPKDAYGRMAPTVFKYLRSNDTIGKIVEELTDWLKTIDGAHHEIHEGDHYFCSETTIIANAEDKIYLIVTPDNEKFAHMVFFTTVSGEATIDLLEGVTVEANGTELDVINNNRNSDKEAGLKIYHTPTNPSGGNDLLNGGARIGLGRNIGGLSRSANEVILKRNTKYLLTISNEIAGGSNITTQLFNWYEKEFNL